MLMGSDHIPIVAELAVETTDYKVKGKGKQVSYRVDRLEQQDYRKKYQMELYRALKEIPQTECTERDYEDRC